MMARLKSIGVWSQTSKGQAILNGVYSVFFLVAAAFCVKSDNGGGAILFASIAAVWAWCSGVYSGRWLLEQLIESQQRRIRDLQMEVFGIYADALRGTDAGGKSEAS